MDEILLRLSGAKRAQAGNYASKLAAELQQLDDVDVRRPRGRRQTQDSGATLNLMFCGSATTELAKGIASWLTRNSAAKIEITHADRSRILLANLDARDTAAIAKALKPNHYEPASPGSMRVSQPRPSIEPEARSARRQG